MLIFVIYDGINNSVFEGQVLTPLLKKVETGAVNKVVIVSFEKVQPTPEVCARINGLHPHLSLITLKRYPFVGTLSLWPAVRQLKKILTPMHNYQLMARGPLAGFICTRAVSWSNCSSLIIQARGLLAEEYKFLTKDERNVIKRIIHQLRIKLFTSLEKTVYSHNKITIEAVSCALKDFLVTQFGAHAHKIFIAQHDLPPQIAPATVATWRHEVRTELNIPETAYVYCFNGSAKAWQCAPEVVAFFEQQYAANTQNFLLVLTQDTGTFQELLASKRLPPSAYTILCVPHASIYRYLSACDAGLMFRQASPVNWVSRPTKVLEYQAVGLKIIHNNTVAWLAHKNNQTNTIY